MENLTSDQLQKKAVRGNAEAQFRLGKLFLLGGNPEVTPNKNQAFNWLMKSASQRFPAGEYLLGTMYFDGNGLLKNQKEAFKYFQRAAEQEFPAAQNKMGECYLHGRGVTKDFTRAKTWFEKAAKQGLADGQYNLGQRYFKAEGVLQSDEKSGKWLVKAANQGHGMAQFLLSQRFAEGGAGKIDFVEAYKWSEISGQENRVDSVRKKMTAEQIKKAELLAEKFQPIPELDPLEPLQSTAIYWLIGIPTLCLYAVVFHRLLTKRRKAAPQEAKLNLRSI